MKTITGRQIQEGLTESPRRVLSTELSDQLTTERTENIWSLSAVLVHHLRGLRVNFLAFRNRSGKLMNNPV
jgi:hypothetical protein